MDLDLFKPQSLQSSTEAAANRNFVQFEARTSDEDDALTLYLRKTHKGLIVETDCVFPGLMVDYDDDHKIVALEILDVSMHTGCHLLDTAGQVEDLLPFVHWRIYDEAVDCLTIMFKIEPSQLHSRQPTDDERIVLLTYDNRWDGLEIHHAKGSVSQPS